MELVQLKCFIAVAEHLHFGKAAQQLEMLPASLGRNLRALEDSLGVALVARTTRHVTLTHAGLQLLEEARDLLEKAERFAERARSFTTPDKNHLRVGAIDSAATGLMPELLLCFRVAHPHIKVTLFEQKTIRIIPRLLSGRLDLAFVRPPESRHRNIVFRPLFPESAVVAMPASHRLSDRERVVISDLADEPLIVPDRRSRPHSHDLTIKLFLEAGLTARIAQVAEEKQTIINLVGTGLGLAIVPRWTARLRVSGVRFVPIDISKSTVRNKLALAIAWVRGTNDPRRDALVETLQANIKHLSKTA